LKESWALSRKTLAIVHFHLYRIHQSRGDLETAASDLENYLKADPTSKNASSIRSEINRLRKKKS
jgi:Tfp pilus assembly protein PilF